MLVDKNTNNPKDNINNPKKSIFSFGDFRHELVCKESTDHFSSLVNQEPKEFLAWDDGKKFNPKLKKDK
jgi:hypothetical protein